MIRMSEDPAETQFPTGDRYNTHRQWIIDSEGMANNTMHKIFTDKMNWIEWKVTLIKFFKSHPRRNVVPLRYAVRDHVNSIARNNPNLLDEYYNRNLLQGNFFLMIQQRFTCISFV